MRIHELLKKKNVINKEERNIRRKMFKLGPFCVYGWLVLLVKIASCNGSEPECRGLSGPWFGQKRRGCLFLKPAGFIEVKRNRLTSGFHLFWGRLNRNAVVSEPECRGF